MQKINHAKDFGGFTWDKGKKLLAFLRSNIL